MPDIHHHPRCQHQYSDAFDQVCSVFSRGEWTLVSIFQSRCKFSLRFIWCIWYFVLTFDEGIYRQRQWLPILQVHQQYHQQEVLSKNNKYSKLLFKSNEMYSQESLFSRDSRWEGMDILLHASCFPCLPAAEPKSVPTAFVVREISASKPSSSLLLDIWQLKYNHWSERRWSTATPQIKIGCRWLIFVIVINNNFRVLLSRFHRSCDNLRTIWWLNNAVKFSCCTRYFTNASGRCIVHFLYNSAFLNVEATRKNGSIIIQYF